MSTPSPSEVALIIPLYNEEAVLPHLVAEIEAFRSERNESIDIIFIDDDSTDLSARLVQSLTGDLKGYQMIRFSRNFGHQKAVSAGINLCKNKAAIILDADLQDPLDVAGRMIDKWKEGYDVVYGVRNKREDVSVIQRITAYWFYRLFRAVGEVDTPVDAGDFRLISRPVIEAFNELDEQQPYVRGLISWLGFRQTGIQYARPGRVAGQTKYPLKKRFRLALDGLTSFSSRPLRTAVNLGLLISAGSVLGLVWVVLTKYVLGTAITGWASLIFAAFFFGGLQLFFLGVVGMYVARVYDEVKGRPRYIISDVWDSGSIQVGSVLDESTAQEA